ncbi:Bcr/CflA family efflux MFS transporter [bacterium]|nr:MAG: Bcr/CflA family efflux MFS transporter [bacterium]
MRASLPAAGSAPTLGMALLLATLSMVSPFSIDSFFPSFPAIAAEYGLDTFEVQQVITAYLIPFSCFTLIHGPLSDALGRRPVVIAGMLVYTAATVGCVFAPTFGVLLAARAMQGMAAGIGPTIARAVVRDLYDGPNAQRLMSAMMMIFSLAPAAAPVIGGWIHVWFGWRSVFGLMLVMGVFLTLFTFFVLPETHPPAKRTPLHFGQLARTSFRIARNGQFMLLAISAALTLASILVFIGSAPAIVLETWGLGETQFYHLFVPIIGGFMLSSFVSNRTAGRIARPRQLMFGFAGVLASSLLALALELLPGTPPRGAQQVLLFGLAFGAQFTFPILTLAMLDLYPEVRGSAASMQSFIALTFVSLVMGFVAPLVHGSMLSLDLLAATGGILGFLAWRWAHYLRLRA